MSIDRVLQLKLVGDVSGINTAISGTRSRLGQLGSQVKSFGIALAADLAIESIDKMGEAIGNAWAGFREGEQAVGRLETVWNNLDLDQADLGPVVDALGDMAKAVGQDDVATLDAFNQALSRTKDVDQAMRDTAIAMDLVAAGKAPDLAAAMAIIQAAAAGSSKVVDKFGLDADTAGGRIEQLGSLVEGAAAKAAALDPLGTLFNALSEDLEGFVGAIAEGDLDGAIGSIGTAISDLGGFLDEVGPKLTEWMDKLTGGKWTAFSDAVGAAFAIVQPLFQGIEDAIAGIGTMVSSTVDLISGIIDGRWNDVWEAALAILRAPFDAIGGIIGGFIETIDKLMPGAINAIVEPIRGAINGIIGFWNSLSLPAIGPFRFGEGTIFDTGNIGPWGPFTVPQIPLLAEGGIIRRATTVLAGEAGPEAIIPLDRMGGMGGGNTYNITVNVPAGADLSEAGRQVVRALQAYERIAGPGWRAA